MLFSCSKVAASALSSRRQGQSHSWVNSAPAASFSDHWEWQLHVIKLARSNVFIAMEQESRFALIFGGIKKGDAVTLLKQLYQRVANHFIWLNDRAAWLSESEAQLAVGRFLQQNRYFDFVLANDRSVQAHINDVAWQLELVAEQAGRLPQDDDEEVDFEERVNSLLRSVRGGDYFLPDEAFFNLFLRRYASVSAAESAQIKERFIAWQQTQHILWQVQQK
ncbi:hypothetical protein HZU77_004840 [Neisseriaceae bacterium TC5R-5]|nr:hypothetical protein [Neisseriaceae bacterium TC5R-5]